MKVSPPILARTSVIGDGRWWERPTCFTHPQCRAFVTDLHAVVRELRILFPAEVCLQLARDGHTHHIIGLFYGAAWIDAVDEILQLGEDLTLCTGWHDNAKFVADLRKPEAYDAARFEVGVWAGLRRVGLVPTHERAVNKSVPRADFNVVDGGVRVAIELKSLSDPRRDRNVGALDSWLSLLATSTFSEAVGTIELEPGDALDALLDHDPDSFRAEFHDRFYDVLRRAVASAVAPGTVAIDGVGLLHVGPRDPTWTATVYGSWGVRGEDNSSLPHAAHRVLKRVAPACRQLAATEADLRCVVVWGSVAHLPCALIKDEIARVLAAGYQIVGLDYLVLLNSHLLGPGPGCTTEAAALMNLGRPDPRTMKWWLGVQSWGIHHRGTPPPSNRAMADEAR